MDIEELVSQIDTLARCTKTGLDEVSEKLRSVTTKAELAEFRRDVHELVYELRCDIAARTDALFKVIVDSHESRLARLEKSLPSDKRNGKDDLITID